MNTSLNIAFFTALLGAGVCFINANGEDESVRFNGNNLVSVTTQCNGESISVWPVAYTDRVAAARAAWAVLQEAADWQASDAHGRQVQSYCDWNHITRWELSDAELVAPNGIVRWNKA